MPTDLRTSLRGPQSYDLARAALAELQRRAVWPTPLNFELWLHIVANPDGPLNTEIEELIRRGELITEDRSEELAAKYLPQRRLDAQVRETGDHLERQLHEVQRAVESAQLSNAEYGRTLSGASRELQHDPAPNEVRRLVDVLSEATLQVRRQNSSLETDLSSSTNEVARLREKLEAAQREAMTDALTSLANRKAFDAALRRACVEAEKTGQPLSLAILDIDHFKRFNDTWGHQTGDQVIRYVASVLSRAAHGRFVAARYGGEEFALIMPGEVAARAMTTLNRVREEIASRSLKRRSTEEDLGVVTVSTGLAQHHLRETPAALLARADAALYGAKRDGRNRVTNAEGWTPETA